MGDECPPPMPIAVETLIIIIVIVSLTIVGSLTFALYWLWKLLIEDRRWTRLQNCNWPSPAPAPTPNPNPWQNYAPMSGSNSSISHRTPSYAPLPPTFDSENVSTFTDSTSVSLVTPSILTVTLPDDEPPKPPPRNLALEVSPVVAEVESGMVPTFRQEVVPNIHVVVLDGTEPPPPYEEHK